MDFAASVGDAERAGLEAALEVSGLLDAWLSPDGRLQSGADGKPILDVQALPRGACKAPLGAWLQAAVPDGCAVPAATVSAVLAGIACAADDPGDCEAWIAPDGRFRLGALAGAWAKPEAVYIGFAARAAARARRLAAIAERLQQLAAELAEVAVGRRRSWSATMPRPPRNGGWRPPTTRCGRPTSSPRRARAMPRRRASASPRPTSATARRSRRCGARSSSSPPMPPTSGCRPPPRRCPRWRTRWTTTSKPRPASARPPANCATPCRSCSASGIGAQEALDDLRHCNDRCADARIEAEQADERLAVLRESIGAKVEELRAELSEARSDVTTGEAHAQGGERAAAHLRREPRRRRDERRDGAPDLRALQR